ncbi:MAG TPA: APC family permease [Xanthobacteraceae bacterium]|nr:APC family permease [Xanthobacteraceae bacterium]
MSILDFVLGRRLLNREYRRRRIGAFEGVPAMGLDGIGSSSYGPEAALAILIPLGALGPGYIGWIMAPIVLLLLILFASYWQTIRAYPNNGGSYIVAKDNLGPYASLLAAAALMIDYVLNVAVGISAGVGALVSAIPTLHPYMLALCLGVLVLIALVNLRGTPDAGRLFALPTYVYIASLLVVLAIGIVKALTSGGHPQPVVAPPHLPPATEAIGIWLVLRAFASGCTAMTGVEAVSNGMSAFREPPVRYGHRTLSAIVLTLGVLLVGIAYLVQVFGIGAMDQSKPEYRSVLSQLAAAAVGQGALYYVAIGSLLCVLTLSATTSFVDFPRLCRLIAQDDYLPRPFAIAGRRLVFSVGIIYLAVTAGLLLFAFGGITDRLIPLFAIGAFLTFTISQSGMMVHWRRAIRQAQSARERSSHQMHFWINATGATTTGAALIVIVIAKFTEGAWITILMIPCVIALLLVIHRYYARIAAETRADPLDLHDTRPPVLLVAVQEWNRLAEKALRLATTLSPDVIAVHLSELTGPQAEERGKFLKARWRRDVEEPAAAAGVPAPQLMVLPAARRAIHEPILKLVDKLEERFGTRRVVVLVPEIVKRRWYQHLLHAHHAWQLRRQLVLHAGSRVTIMNVPWYVD